MSTNDDKAPIQILLSKFTKRLGEHVCQEICDEFIESYKRDPEIAVKKMNYALTQKTDHEALGELFDWSCCLKGSDYWAEIFISMEDGVV